MEGEKNYTFVWEMVFPMRGSDVKLNDIPRTTHTTYVATTTLLEAISIKMIWFDLVQSQLYVVNHMKLHSPSLIFPKSPTFSEPRRMRKRRSSRHCHLQDR